MFSMLSVFDGLYLMLTGEGCKRLSSNNENDGPSCAFIFSLKSAGKIIVNKIALSSQCLCFLQRILVIFDQYDKLAKQ